MKFQASCSHISTKDRCFANVTHSKQHRAHNEKITELDNMYSLTKSESEWVA